MLSALAAGLLVFAVTWLVLMAGEKLLHKLTHNPWRVYRWGVWTLSILLGGYTFFITLGTF